MFLIVSKFLSLYYCYCNYFVYIQIILILIIVEESVEELDKIFFLINDIYDLNYFQNISIQVEFFVDQFLIYFNLKFCLSFLKIVFSVY